MTDTDEIIGGADTHADTIHVAVISAGGQPVADREFPTTETGYHSAIEFLTRHGVPRVVGVEGTSSYGAGFTRALASKGIPVLEVHRPDRAARRCRGKTDTLDAYAAARAALCGHGVSEPKDERIGVVRALLSARRSAVKARTASINQIKALLVSAPEVVRSRFRQHRAKQLIDALIETRSNTHGDPMAAGIVTAARTLAERVVFLDDQVEFLTDELDQLTAVLCPTLRSAYGVGPDTAAQLLVTAGENPQRLRGEGSFAALCGAAPVPASSGKTVRHRLSRGGDRAANNALHRIALCRMARHAPTRAYAARQSQAGRSKPEILRLLKRAIAREIYRLLTRAVTPPDYADLRRTRQERNITLTAAARHLGVWPGTLSRLERGQSRDDELANTYRAWLAAA
ncbi:transposase [Nocardia tenerifensis]|uniref:Transposase n=1 Tax=Nocardia tenerifensis TaxID=228006 RepID=A0A318K8I0_9NOCA|nr:IS110 family transposase [Nocardia tenerifensis]PXX60343.1 transposase [Nocardia tenerifensis]